MVSFAAEIERSAEVIFFGYAIEHDPLIYIFSPYFGNCYFFLI